MATRTEDYFKWDAVNYRTRATIRDGFGGEAWKLVQLDDSRTSYVLWYEDPIAYVDSAASQAHIEMMTDDRLNVTMALPRNTTWANALKTVAEFIGANL